MAAERAGRTPEEVLADLQARWGEHMPVAISVMSAGELLHGCWRADNPVRRGRRQAFVESVVHVFPVVEVSLPVIRIFAEVDALLTKSGERLPTSDLLIACTALIGKLRS